MAHPASHISVTQLDSAINNADQTHKAWLYVQPGMTFRDASRLAIDLYSKREFEVFQNEFDQVRQQYATGLGLLTHIQILDKKNEPTLEGVFSMMTQEQSKRFQSEFFDGILPHWMARQDLWKNLRDPQQGDYQFKMEGSWFSKMLFKFVAHMLSEKDFIETVVMTSKSTWIDDDKKTINVRATFK